jgi:hypothetical protein
MRLKRQDLSRKIASPRSLRYLLGLGSIGFSVWTTWRPDQVAGIMAVEEDKVQQLGARDLRCGLEILMGENPRQAIVSRIAYDVDDAVLLLQRRPLLAVTAIATALLGIAAFITND